MPVADAVGSTEEKLQHVPQVEPPPLDRPPQLPLLAQKFEPVHPEALFAERLVDQGAPSSFLTSSLAV